jgi:hypothetical protein
MKEGLWKILEVSNDKSIRYLAAIYIEKTSGIKAVYQLVQYDI